MHLALSIDQEVSMIPGTACWVAVFFINMDLIALFSCFPCIQEILLVKPCSVLSKWCEEFLSRFSQSGSGLPRNLGRMG